MRTSIWAPFNHSVRRAIVVAHNCAQADGCATLGTDYILYAIVAELETPGTRLLKSRGATAEALQSKMQMKRPHYPTSPIQLDFEQDAQAAVYRAHDLIAVAHDREIAADALLLAMVSDADSACCQLLRALSVDTDAVQRDLEAVVPS